MESQREVAKVSIYDEVNRKWFDRKEIKNLLDVSLKSYDGIYKVSVE